MIPDDCKVGPGESVMEIRSRPDEQGRVSFTLYWWGYNAFLGRNGTRAQEFFAIPDKHALPGMRVIDRMVTAAI